MNPPYGSEIDAWVEKAAASGTFAKAPHGVQFNLLEYPFEYPREWVIERNYSWNEVYAVRAFLMYNNLFEVLFFNDQFGRLCGDLVAREAPAMSTNYGGGLWLVRRSDDPKE